MDKRKLKRKRPESEETTSSGSTCSDSSSSGDTVILEHQSDEDSAALVEVGDGEAGDGDESGEGSEDDNVEDASLGSVVASSTQENPKRQVPLTTAKTIVQVAFNAICFKDVAKKQLISYIKKYGLIKARESQNLEKEKAAQIVAGYLLEKKIIHIDAAKDLKEVRREDIIKKKAF